MNVLLHPLRFLCLLIALAGVPGMGAAQNSRDMSSGLMWNRTGLPAVFPLQVRTPVGWDYYLHLSDAKTGAPALAAYIRGGGFFRVLVPPGEFTVRFAYGRDWQGEDALFASSAGSLELDTPLGFAVKGLSRKTGHVIDLRPLVPQRDATVRVAPVVLCQGVRLAAFDPLASLYGVEARDLLARAWRPLTPVVQDDRPAVQRMPARRIEVIARPC